MLQHRFKKFIKFRYILVKELKPMLNKFNEILHIKLNKLQSSYTYKKYKDCWIFKIELTIYEDVLATLIILEHYKLIKSIKTFCSLTSLYKYY